MNFNIEVCRKCEHFNRTWQLVTEIYVCHCLVNLVDYPCAGDLPRIGSETKDGVFYLGNYSVPEKCAYLLELILLENKSKSLDESPE